MKKSLHLLILFFAGLLCSANAQVLEFAENYAPKQEYALNPLQLQIGVSSKANELRLRKVGQDEPQAYVGLKAYEGETLLFEIQQVRAYDDYLANFSSSDFFEDHLYPDVQFSGFELGKTYRFEFTLYNLSDNSKVEGEGNPLECSFTIVEKETQPYSLQWVYEPKKEINIFGGYDEFYFVLEAKENKTYEVPKAGAGDDGDEENPGDLVVEKAVTTIGNLYIFKNDQWQAVEDIDQNNPLTKDPENPSRFILDETAFLAWGESPLEKLTAGDSFKLEIFLIYTGTQPWSRYDQVEHTFKVVNREYYPVMDWESTWAPQEEYALELPFSIGVNLRDCYLKTVQRSPYIQNAYVGMMAKENGKACFNIEKLIGYNEKLAMFSTDKLEEYALTGFEGFKKDNTYEFTFTLYHSRSGNVWTNKENQPISKTCTFKVLNAEDVWHPYTLEWVEEPGDTVRLLDNVEQLSFQFKIMAREKPAKAEIPATLQVMYSFYNDTAHSVYDYLVERERVYAEDGVYTIDFAALENAGVKKTDLTEGAYVLDINLVDFTYMENTQLYKNLHHKFVLAPKAEGGNEQGGEGEGQGSANENALQINCRVYPNPCNGAFTVEAAEPALMQIFNLRGECVEQRNINAGNTAVGLQSAGLYFVRLTSGAKSTVVRVAVK